MEILSSYTDGFCRLCDRIAKKSNEYGPMKTINTKRAIHTEPALAKVKRNKSWSEWNEALYAKIWYLNEISTNVFQSSYT